jgi:hypothetical protein
MISFDDAYELLHGLSKPSKMPWYSWSIPAQMCKTGSKLAQKAGTVCEGCYALDRGFYAMPNVKNAQAERFKALSDPRFVDAFVVVLTKFYETGRKTYKVKGKDVKENRFRWHDSGDLQSVKHLEQINEIARRTPMLRHWVPTKEPGFVAKFLAKHGKFADNLVVRISHPMVGQTFENKRPSDMPIATVGYKGKGVKQCPAAASQGNKCLDCDTCWVGKNLAVNYPLH